MLLIKSFLRQHGAIFLCLSASVLLLANSLPYWFSSYVSVANHHEPRTIAIVTPPPPVPLSDYALFGEATETNHHSVETTLLNLTLIGVLNASDEKNSQALIKTEDEEEEKLYVIGDKINTNTVLWRVLDNAVLLKRNGTIERLSLPKNTLNTKAVQAPPLSKDELK